jgi:3-carboxy-cis,cis-muconate cycloisomerase
MIQVSPFDSTLFNPLLSDEETGALFNDEAFIKAMLYTEGALAKAQAAAGMLPESAARAISQAAQSLSLDPSLLAQATASAGVPVPALVKQLKAHLAEEDAKWVHYGATSQDIVDTAAVLILKEVIAISEVRLKHVIHSLAALAKTHEHTLVAGRTRTQQAVPMSFGIKVAQWLSPLLRQLERLEQLKPRLLKTQLAGAVGTLAAMGEYAVDTGHHFADTLGLECGDNWHTQRDSFVEWSSWSSMTTGLLGKMAQDWLWMSSTECAEIRFTNGGGSSTMPQKCNPVNAETIVAIMRLNAGWCGQMHQAMMHEHERSGSQWTQEWFILPNQCMGLNVALRHTQEALEHIVINTEQMLTNLSAFNGVIYAEAITFELASSLGRDTAAAMVKEASQAAIRGEGHLFDLIKTKTGHAIDTERLQSSLVSAGATTPWFHQILAHADQLT